MSQPCWFIYVKLNESFAAGSGSKQAWSCDQIFRFKVFGKISGTVFGFVKDVVSAVLNQQNVSKYFVTLSLCPIRRYSLFPFRDQRYTHCNRFVFGNRVRSRIGKHSFFTPNKPGAPTSSESATYAIIQIGAVYLETGTMHHWKGGAGQLTTRTLTVPYKRPPGD